MTGDTGNILNKVVLSAKGSILNSSTDEDANVIAKNIELFANKDIGSIIKYFNVNTALNSLNNGLKVKAVDAYINGVGSDLTIIGSDVKEKLSLKSPGNTNILGEIVASNLTIDSEKLTNISNSIINGNLNNSYNIKNLNFKKKLLL